MTGSKKNEILSLNEFAPITWVLRLRAGNAGKWSRGSISLLLKSISEALYSFSVYDGRFNAFFSSGAACT